ncbi:hypothetical protein QTP88_005736 [Uroleucon formosanum]
MRWHCVKRSLLNCSASLTTDLLKNNPLLIKNHSHSADLNEISVTKCLAEMKNKATITEKNPSTLFAEGIFQLNINYKSRMPPEQLVKRTLQNKKKSNHPIGPADLSQLNISDEWITTGEPNHERFLLHDNNNESNERIIIFATDERLRYLAEADEWENEFFSTFCRMLGGLAFLPINDVPRELIYLKTIIPQEANELMEYFDSTYIEGKIIKNNARSNVIRRTPAAFPPSVWNVHEVTLNDGQRTNNQTEGWNHRSSKLVNRSHPSIWLLIEKMRLELGVDEVKIGQRDIGQPLAKKKKCILVCKKN